MIFFLAADNGLGPGTQTNSSYVVELLVYIILILVTLYLLLKYWPTLKLSLIHI